MDTELPCENGSSLVIFSPAWTDDPLYNREEDIEETYVSTSKEEKEDGELSDSSSSSSSSTLSSFAIFQHRNHKKRINPKRSRRSVMHIRSGHNLNQIAKAPPPMLVQISSGAIYDIDIDDHRCNWDTISYWGLPFSTKTVKRGDWYNARLCQRYEEYIMSDVERVYHLPGLSGVRLGCTNIDQSHGKVLLRIFEELKITISDCNDWRRNNNAMPLYLRESEMRNVQDFDSTKQYKRNRVQKIHFKPTPFRPMK